MTEFISFLNSGAGQILCISVGILAGAIIGVGVAKIEIRMSKK